MRVFIFLAILFLLLGILGLIYLVSKIKKAVRYFGSQFPKNRQRLMILGIFAIILLPAFFSFLKWFIVFMHLIVFLALTDLAVFTAKKLRAKTDMRFPGWLKSAWMKGAYRAGAFALLLTVIVSCYAKYNMYHVVRTDYEINVNKSLSEDITLVMIADLHYGLSLDAAQLQKVADAIEKESPDAVILCGDLVDESTTSEGMKEAFSILGGIESRFGVYFVYGNHDRSRYQPDAHFSEMQLAETLTDSRITILQDHAVTFNDDILLVGREDRSDPSRKSIDELLDGYDTTKTIIVADHQPSEYDHLQKAGCDLVVSGHTHGGQTFPLGFFNDLIRFSDLNYGYKKQGHLNAVVTSGIAGWGYDLRTEHHSEYVVIHINGNQ